MLTPKEWDRVRTAIDTMHTVNLHGYGEVVIRQNVLAILQHFVGEEQSVLNTSVTVNKI